MRLVSVWIAQAAEVAYVSVLLNPSNAMEQNRPWETDGRSYGNEIQPFKEPEVLLPCSQVAATGLYPEPAEYSPYPIYLGLILIFSRYLRPHLPNSLPLRFSD
jgi:hypothetical protein